MAKKAKKSKKNTEKTTQSKKSKKAEQKPIVIPNTVVTLNIPKDEAQAAYNRALAKMAKTVKISGFRKGNVPPKVAEEHLNTESIIEEALREIIPPMYSAQIKTDGVVPLTYPEFKAVSVNKGEDWVMEAHVGEPPKIDLKGYKKVVKSALKTAEKEFKKQEKARKEHAKECKDEKHNHAEPTEQEIENFKMQYIYRDLVNHTHPQVQEMLVKEETENDIRDIMNQLKQYKIPFEKFLERRGVSAEEFTNQLAANAITRIQTSFIIDEIAEEQKFAVNQEELDKEFDKITDEKLREQQKQNPRYTEMMRQTLIRRKVADYLLSLA